MTSRGSPAASEPIDDPMMKDDSQPRLPAPRATLAAGILAVVLSGCGGDAPSREREESATPPVEAVVAREGALPLQERVSGTVKARNQIAVRSQIEAPIVEVLVRSGDSVQKNQPLVRLDDTQLRAQLRQAEAAVRLASAAAQQSRARLAELNSEVTRARSLAAERLISEMELETLEAQLNAARANVAQEDARVEQAQATAAERRNALTRTVIRAPAAGRVGARNAEVGMIAGGDTVLFALGDPGDLIVEIPVSQEMLRLVKVGDPVDVRPGAGEGGVIRGRLARISPFLAEQSFSTVGEVEIPAGAAGLAPGMFVSADIMYGQSGMSTLIPATALWEDPATGDQAVFVVTSLQGVDARSTLEDPARPVQRRDVRVLAQGGGMAGVEGVRAGEWIVVTGQHLLAEDESTTAHVRTAEWERILNLQALQREDLMADYMAKQQRYARANGSEPPSNVEYMAQSPATPRKVN